MISVFAVVCTILEQDHGHTTPSGVPIAFYVHYAAARSTNGSKAPLTSAERILELASKCCRQYGDDAEPLSVDYFDADTLRAFLATRENKHNVILQKIVHGRADHASMMQVVWSPHRILATQRQNKHSLNDIRVPLYQRTNTFDNTTHLSLEMRPTAVMSARLDTECRKVVDHIAAVEQRVVIRMVAFFAFDQYQKAVLLFASEFHITSQPATEEFLRHQLSLQMKRKLCMVSPQIIPSDVIFPHYARIGNSNKTESVSASSSGLGAKLTVKESAQFCTSLAGTLSDARAASFEEEMDVLDKTFSSAYESRLDRGKLTNGQRHTLVGTSVFAIQQASPQTFKEFEVSSHRKMRSFLTHCKVFYPSASQEGASIHSNRPQSAASNVNEHTWRPTSSMRHSSVARSPITISRSHSPSLVLHGELGFCSGGGSGLFLKRRAKGAQQVDPPSAIEMPNDSDFHSSLHSDHLFASVSSPLQSPACLRPMPQPSNNLTNAASLTFPGTLMNPQSAIEWRRVLRAVSNYRRMVSHTETLHHTLRDGRTVESSKTADAEHATVERVRSDPSMWMEAQFPDPIRCASTDIVFNEPSPNSTIGRVNLWKLLHPCITKDWVVWSANRHRSAIDAVECLMSELDRLLHTTLSASGLSTCNVTLPMSITLGDEARDIGLPPPRGSCTEPAVVKVPWWISSWMLWYMIHPSQPFPPPNAKSNDQSQCDPERRSSACQQSMKSSRFVDNVHVLTEMDCKRLCSWVLKNMSANNVVACSEDNNELLLQVVLPNVSQENMTRIQASLRGLLSTLNSSWSLHGIMVLESTLAIAQTAPVVPQKRAGRSPQLVVDAPESILSPDIFVEGDNRQFSKEEWDVLLETCSSALAERSKSAQSANFEWPPRWTITA